MPYKDLIKIRVWSIYRDNWHYQAINLPDGYKNIIEVIKAVGNWKGIKLIDDKIF